MRRFVGRAALAVALACALIPSAGCCAIFCRRDPPPAPSRLRRDSPHDTIRFLVDAIRRRGTTEIYETLHPAFVTASGDYSLADFSAGFDYFEDEFRADADRLDRAVLGEPIVDQGITWVSVKEGTSSADIGFVNVPTLRVSVDDEFFPEITAKIPRVSRVATIEDDTLLIAVPIPLGGQGASVAGAAVKRVELANNWLLYDIRNTSGIRIADVLKNESGALQQRKPKQ